MDITFHTKAAEHTLPPPDAPYKLPDWVDASAVSLKGLVPPSTAHYVATVQVGVCVLDAIVDLGGACTVIDKVVAHWLGLKVDLATRHTKYGSF